MNFLLLIGPQAVGKMTVGEEIAKKTGMKLFHNHKSIEPFLEYFTFDESKPLIKELRENIFNRFIEQDKYDLIFTYVFAFDQESDQRYYSYLLSKFKDHNFYIAELNAGLDTRLKRNVTENRLNKKPSKRNTEWSSNELKSTMERYRLVSKEGEITEPNYIRVITDNLSVEETTDIIINKFKFKRIEKN